MTAEIGVMNRIGVALAADSAVTVGPEAEKIYISAEKLFQLSACAPVGVMVYGNANYLNIPWETTIKAYRAELGARRFHRLSEYSQHFLRFLRGNRNLFPTSKQDEQAAFLVSSLFQFLRDGSIKVALDREAEERGGLTERDVRGIVDDRVEHLRLRIAGHDALKGFSAKEKNILRLRLRASIAEIAEKTFGSLPMSPESHDKLFGIAIEMLTRHFFGPFQCGLVVAGFGEREYMPSLLAYEMEEMLLNRPRCALVHDAHIGAKTDSMVIPFAQQDMVHAFMRGIDPDLSEHIEKTTSVLFKDASEAILKAVERADKGLGQQLRRVTIQNVQKLLRSLFKEWEERQSSHWGPVVQVVSSLPKGELAEMAESLVNLTRFRRRVTTERETVGGPIDVAVITKGDGFVWVKRKHYFDASLNPRVIARYQKEG